MQHAASARSQVLNVGGREVTLSSPDKVLFPQPGYTKLDLANYYVAIADGALRGAGNRPNVLVRYPDGIGGEHFYQKRAPASRPEWLQVVALQFPSGRSAEEIVPREPAALAWLANLACLELHPHPVRADDLEQPDELRVDLDPVPGVEWRQVQDVHRRGARRARRLRADRLAQDLRLARHARDRAHRAALGVRRGAPRGAGAGARGPSCRGRQLATSKWWKEERHGVFVDYNQNAKDATVAAAYSVRPVADARVSAPLAWDEVATCNPADFTLATMPARFAQLGDLHAGIDAHAGSLHGLLQLFERQGLGDAPWPPHYRRGADEPPRVAPSRQKKPLIEIGRARRKEDALAGFERWKARHAQAAAHLQPADVLVDAMRGRYSTWTRVRVNLEHVPPEQRPAQEPLDPDEKMRASS